MDKGSEEVEITDSQENEANKGYPQKTATIITNLIQKKCSMQDKMYAIRYDETRDDDDKEMDLKKLADEINEMETKIIELIQSSTSSFIKMLELPTEMKKNIC